MTKCKNFCKTSPLFWKLLKEQFRKFTTRYKMLFKYTFKNTVHRELNRQAAPNYRANETTDYIYRTHFLWRNPKALYK